MSPTTGRGFLAAITVLVVITLILVGVSAFRTFEVSPSGLEIRIGAVEKNQQQLSSSIESIGKQVKDTHDAVLVPEVLKETPEPPSDMVAVRWVSTEFTRLEGIDFAVHEAPKAAVWWATITLKPGETRGMDVLQKVLNNKEVFYNRGDLVGKRLDKDTIFVKPGEEVLVTLVFKSKVDKDQQFAAVPHLYYPDSFKGVSLLSAVGEQCLCVAVFYPLPANGEFIRVIKLVIDPTTPPGARVVLDHKIYGPPPV